MSMTANEALERANRIWGNERVKSVRVYPDSVYVELHPAGIASDTRGQNYVAHRLDGNGHPTCHDACKRIEANLPF